MRRATARYVPLPHLARWDKNSIDKGSEGLLDRNAGVVLKHSKMRQRKCLKPPVVSAEQGRGGAARSRCSESRWTSRVGIGGTDGAVAASQPTELYAKILHDPAHRDPRGYILPADQADFADSRQVRQRAA